jgi:hypothetical protein
VLFGKHNLTAKDTIHKTIVLVLKKCVKQKVWAFWAAADNPRKCEMKQHKICGFIFNSVLLDSAFVEVRRSLSPSFSG